MMEEKTEGFTSPNKEHPNGNGTDYLQNGPTPVSYADGRRPRQKFDRHLQKRFMAFLLGFMIVIAIATEVAVQQSEKHNGWLAWDIQGFGGLNYLKSMIPTAVVTPLMNFWTSVDGELGKLQPFVAVSKGNVPAAASLGLAYGGRRFGIIRKALMYRHWVILMSSAIFLAMTGIPTLASGVLTTKSSVVTTYGVPVTSLKTLGLIPDYNTLEYFVAASGYTAAAAIHNLTDPPFLYKGSWALAEFLVPSMSADGTNQTVFLQTTGVESVSNCQPADSQNIIDNDTAGELTITGSWSGCTITFNAADNEMDQYGVLPLDDCQVFQEPPQYQPVIFWFYSFEKRLPSLTFCQPSLQLWNVLVGVDMQTNLISNVTLLDQNVAQSNVTGLPAFNGISFNTTGADTYTQARASATTTTVPFAIYQSGVYSPGGVSAVIQQPDGFLNLTNTVYTRFLALSAQSIYYVNTNPQQSAQTGYITSIQVRLWVYPLGAHVFAGVLLLLALFGGVMFWLHTRERKDTFVSCDTGTISGTLSMTSRGRFIDLLQAGMTDEELDRALAGKRFGISRRTWQIVAEDERDAEDVSGTTDQLAYGRGAA